MKGRTLIGLVLVLVGLGITLYGLGSALSELVGLYAGALKDAMADPANGGERGVSARMTRDVWVGVAGVPVLLVGYVLLHVGVIGAIRRLGNKR
jgi:hypothetical protein